MARTAKLRTVYTSVPMAAGDAGRGLVEYVVGTRQGSVEATWGRVIGSSSGVAGWSALGVGAAAWTAWFPTRREAVAAMFGTGGN